MRTNKKTGQSEIVASRKSTHAARCRVCLHPKLEEIDGRILNWESPATIARECKITVFSIRRHMRATNLVERRNANVRAGLGQLAEKGISARRVPPSVGLAALIALSKINTEGAWVNRTQVTDMAAMLERCDEGELRRLAEHGEKPRWWDEVLSAATSG
jgi:hypothetical protein